MDRSLKDREELLKSLDNIQCITQTILERNENIYILEIIIYYFYDYIVWAGYLVPHDIYETSKDENLMI